jgi:dienelactone hydrolase
VVRVGVAYTVGAWLIIQVAETIFPLFDYDDVPARYVVIVLAIGFIPTLIFSWAYELTSQGLKREEDVDRSDSIKHVTGRKLDFFIISLLTIALLVIGANWFSGRGERWARDEASPQIENHVAAGDWEAAYALAKQVSNRAPAYDGLEDLWRSMSWITTIPSEPPGAMVYRRPYDNPDAEWEALGRTPLSNIRYPFGLSVLRFEIADRPAVFRIMGGGVIGGQPGLRVVEQRPFNQYGNFHPEPFRIDAADDLPEDMVRVPGWRLDNDGQAVDVRDFFIGRYEVTNAEYQRFVDAGGYENSEYWAAEFEKDGQALIWDEAVQLMVDQSGRRGPGTWIGGTFPAGQADHPVAGVSWYEADAYARFVGAELPTYSHWRRAISAAALPWMLPASNLDGEGTAAVDEFDGISWTGALDLAGNVREWCFSPTDEGRVILGGAWNDAEYVVLESILDASSLPPFDRSRTNGFRLARTSDDTRAAELLRASVTVTGESLDAEPVSDEIFAVFRNLFQYDNEASLSARIEKEEIRGPWEREYITFDAPYDDERIGLYLYLPNDVSGPLQTVLFWGGTGWLVLDSIDRYKTPIEFVLQSGRAVAVPVLAGTFQRRNDTRVQWSTIAGRDLVIRQIKDLRRAVDYLQTRSDVDAEAIGYFGFSWGGRLGGIVLAMEDRIRAGVFDQAGLQHLQHPETSVVNYLPRVETPVLQFNGVYDTDFRFDTSAVPFFELLGTSPEHKKHVTAPTEHFVPRPVVVGETLDWYDRYLGPPD